MCFRYTFSFKIFILTIFICHLTFQNNDKYYLNKSSSIQYRVKKSNDAITNLLKDAENFFDEENSGEYDENYIDNNMNLTELTTEKETVQIKNNILTTILPISNFTNLLEDDENLFDKNYTEKYDENLIDNDMNLTKLTIEKETVQIKDAISTTILPISNFTNLLEDEENLFDKNYTDNDVNLTELTTEKEALQVENDISTTNLPTTTFDISNPFIILTTVESPNSTIIETASTSINIPITTSTLTYKKLISNEKSKIIVPSRAYSIYQKVLEEMKGNTPKPIPDTLKQVHNYPEIIINNTLKFQKSFEDLTIA